MVNFCKRVSVEFPEFWIVDDDETNVSIQTKPSKLFDGLLGASPTICIIGIERGIVFLPTLATKKSSANGINGSEDEYPAVREPRKNLKRSVNWGGFRVIDEVVQDDDSSYLLTQNNLNLYLQDVDLQASNGREYRAIVVYAPEENVNVEVIMAGSAGVSFNNNLGGSGGKCTFTYTLQQNTEYVFLLGETQGNTSSVGRGGAGAYFYEKGR